MKKTGTYYLIIGMIISATVSLCGCDVVMQVITPPEKAEKKKAAKKVPYIQDISLAESIMHAPTIEVSLSRDPFRPAIKDFQTLQETDRKQEEGVILTGIYNSNPPVALIESSQKTYVVQEQEYVEDFLVKKIMEDRVLLEKNGESMTLTIGGQE